MTRGGIADFVLGVSQFEQHERSIAVGRRFVKRPAEQRSGGVGGAAAECRLRGRPQQSRPLGLPLGRRASRCTRNGAGIGPLLVQQACGATV